MANRFNCIPIFGLLGLAMSHLPPIKLSVSHWAAWAPGLTNKEAWQRWFLQPTPITEQILAPAEKVPALQRRRFSGLSRMVLTVLADIPGASDANYSVFGSRHGEIKRTFSLLQNLTKDEILSPMVFSQSVHNTASGLFTIVEKIQQTSTSIANGADTFASAWIEAYAYLATHPKEQVLLVIFDESLPVPYQAQLSQQQPDYCFALLLKATQGQGISFELTASAVAEREYPQGLEFLPWLHSGQPELGLAYQQHGIRFFND